MRIEVLQDNVTWHDPQLTFANPESMVQVISGLFKGYLGYIKSVNVLTIDVEMVTPVGRLYAFSFSQLAFWSHGGRLLPLDPSIQIRSESPSTLQPSTPQSSVLKLEASAESSSVLAVDPMWDPSSQMPGLSDLHSLLREWTPEAPVVPVDFIPTPGTAEWLLLPTFAGALETYVVSMQLVNTKPHKEQGVVGFEDGRHKDTQVNTVPGLLPRDGKVAVEFKTQLLMTLLWVPPRYLKHSPACAGALAITITGPNAGLIGKATSSQNSGQEGPWMLQMDDNCQKILEDQRNLVWIVDPRVKPRRR
ncbi:hypothetical protein AcV5_001761 [Taiwanofungus camphoratus]|nr:hypothetical protein AcV5_001761 [Antrodia cinnamomea]